jgi:Protein of unknown function (DUF4239)
MSYFAACLIVLLSTLAAAGASFVVARTISLEMRRRHHEVGSPVFQQIGIMFAVLLAFVFSEIWSQYNTAAEAINGECAALHGAAMLADSLAEGRGAPAERAIIDYGAAVVNTEWPAMARRMRSPAAVADFRAIIDQTARLDVNGPTEAAVKSQMLSLLAQAHAFRETRTFQINRALPAPLWFVLITISAVLVWFVLMAGLEGPGHMLFAAAFTFCTVMVLVLVRMLDFPFEGALTLSPADFVKMTNEVSALLGAAPATG